MTSKQHILIIGGGVYGLGSAYWARRLNPSVSVTLLETHSIGHARGSSYGDSRLYRQMHSSLYYAEMAFAALKLWHDLEASTGESLLSPHGLLFYGRPDTGETIEGSLPGALATLKDMQLPHRYFKDARQLNLMFPMRAAPGEQGVLEAGAGIIHADRVRSCLRDAALRNGAMIYEEEAAEGLSIEADGKVRVRTSRGRTLLADRVIIAAGPWTNDVLSHLGYSFALEIWRCHWGFYSCDADLVAELPLWYYFGQEDPATSDGGLYYGFPAAPATQLIKVGLDYVPPGEEFRTKSMARFMWEPHERMVALLEGFMQSRWPGRCHSRGLAVSPYTMTADQDFILDRLPGLGQVVVFAGDCGRGFKFSVLLSKVLAELALDRQPCHDVRPLSATRAAVGLRRNTNY